MTACLLPQNCLSLPLQSIDDMDAASAHELQPHPVGNPLAQAKPAKPPKRHTLGEYLRREERSAEKHEYFDGIIKAIPMAKGPHNEITANTIAALKNAVKQLATIYRVFSNDQKIYIPELNVGLYPDALVVCEKPEYWDEEALLLTNPLLIVEVLSKSTRHYDYGSKFNYYKTLPSFKEYVLIEQTECRVETWFREAPDLWRNTVVSDLAEPLALRSLGCELRLADVYEHIAFEPQKVRGQTGKARR
jgi:Uma2 family endonuclease